MRCASCASRPGSLPLQRRSRPRQSLKAGRGRQRCSHTRDDRPKRLVRRYYEDVFAGRCLDVLDALVAPGFVGHDSSGATMDRDRYFDALRMMHEAFAQLEVFIDDQIAENDRVTTRWSAVGTHIGDFAGIAATGRNVTMSGIDIHRVEGDRLVESWEQLDLATIISQMM
jgi:predicted ester cyclase